MPAQILVIEDNAANLELITYLLRAFGHTVKVARDGDEGLELIGKQPPDLVICDVHLPTVNGYEVAHQMKRNPATKEIPLIAVTALAMMGDRDKVLSAGFDGYISKPISAETFVQQVERFLGLEGQSRFQNAQPDPAPQRPQDAFPAPYRATVLVVDDLPINISLKQTMLEPFGYRVVAARSLEEALHACYESHPDLILSDIHLQDGTGYDLLRELRNRGLLKTTPVLFLSATATSSDRQRVRELGLKLLVRPVEPEVLLAEIAAALSFREDASNDGQDTGR